MNVILINATCGIGSTGKICLEISKLLTNEGHENLILYSYLSDGYSLGRPCSSSFRIKMQALKAKVLGNYGFNSNKETNKMIEILEEFNPDIVHLHNVHGHDCNLNLLLSYLKRKKIKVIWTFHDCWAFTGYCTHFLLSKCNKWTTGCNSCIQRKKTSLFFDRSKEIFERKKFLLADLNFTIVTPSLWLSDMVRLSYLKSHTIKVINNGIDLGVFKPYQNLNTKLTGKYIILGVAFDWEYSKGIDVFINLYNLLDKDLFQIVLVGTNKKIDKILPNGIKSIHRTKNQIELAKLYSIADVFVNPTREDTFPTVNIEALACGTPVITYNSGGSPEIIDKTCGTVIQCEDIVSLKKEIIKVCKERPYSKEACIKRANLFDKNDKFKEYIQLYKEVMNE